MLPIISQFIAKAKKPENFNRLIDIKIKTANSIINIVTPRKKGIKPFIEISGTLTPASVCTNIEVRIYNLYKADILPGAEIEISAGYEGNMSAGIKGQVMMCYTDTPAPDKITTIFCSTGYFVDWLTKTIDLHLPQNYTLDNAIQQITQALGFESYEIDPALISKMSIAPLNHNGLCSTAIDEVKKAFPDVNISIVGKKLRVYKTDEKQTAVVLHTLTCLTQPPQFSGAAVNLVAPWEPMVKCGDYVTFPTQYATTDLTNITFATARVDTLQFHFSTVGSANEMVISGTNINALDVDELAGNLTESAAGGVL